MKVTVPLHLSDGRLATVHISRPDEGLDPKLVRIEIPKRAADVNPAREPPVIWTAVDLDELLLPEHFFSPEILAKLDDRDAGVTQGSDRKDPNSTVTIP